ncbi:hypothetical protein FB45DRAFT_837762 [Roridomyces roridus]|uniref:F-box domain-containing protein n=1 Tax=Roridomyces roridus TaxID=1738132 RepID=A0AAD7BK19_9AGAR|nr:hypothetical protein FB45DRAFT_837762 [Roridomyces roridus]
MSIAGTQDYQKQSSIVRRADGSLSFANVTRLALVLPPELTSAIFAFCLPESEFVEPDPSAAPLLLLRVCRRWRDIALSTPALWASLHINLEWFYGCKAVDVLFCDWISRSGRMPLSIKIFDDYGVAEGTSLDESQLERVLRMLGRHSAQWQNIRFSVYAEHLLCLFPVDGKFPRLRNFSVESTGDTYVGWKPLPGYPPRILRDAHTLREINLAVVPWPDLQFPWQSLEVYTADNMSMFDCLNVLRDGISIMRCSFSLMPRLPQKITPLPPITSLRDLTLIEAMCDSAARHCLMPILENLTLPSLKHLALKFQSPSSDLRLIETAPFVSFVTRSSLQLESLTVCLMPASDRDFLRCLESVPSLINLQLQLDDHTSAFLNRLTSDSRFLPGLKTLHVANFSTSEFNAPYSEEMLAMMSSRWNPPEGSSKLEVFRFTHGGTQVLTTALESHSTYSSLQAEGMELVFEGFDSWVSRPESWWMDDD